MMPYHRNPHFTGRDQLLIQLVDKLNETNPKKYNYRIAIYGMGGVGKTQLAIEYVYRYEARYNGIFWISAGDRAALLSGFQEMATITRCWPPVDLKPPERAQAV